MVDKLYLFLINIIKHQFCVSLLSSNLTNTLDHIKCIWSKANTNTLHIKLYLISTNTDSCNFRGLFSIASVDVLLRSPLRYINPALLPHLFHSLTNNRYIYLILKNCNQMSKLWKNKKLKFINKKLETLGLAA